jgi:hypothetical protein
MRVFGLLILFAAICGAEERYRDPILFQRAEVDPATKKVIHNGKLWVMDLDGSKLKQLTFGASYDEHPSLYGDQIHGLYSEFAEGRLNNERDGRLMKIDIYTGEKEVADEETGCALHHASISPMDDLIAYHYNCGKRIAQAMDLGKNRYETEVQATNGVRTRDGIIAMHEKNTGLSPREVSLIHIRGRGVEATAAFLAVGKLLHRRPAISPDGKLLAWQTNAPDGGEDEIYLANVDGSSARNLTKAKGNDGHPWFSRDGKTIVFESDRSGAWEIWKIDLETGKQTQLTDGKGRYQSTRARM